MTEFPDNLVLFDGVCNFCNGSVQFIIRHDKKNRFVFAPLQSPTGIALRQKFGLDDKALQSMILHKDGKIYTKTSAALRICRHLNGAWPLMYGFIIVPPFIRDVVYNIIAKNRYKWWGKSESCMMPTPEQRKKFIDTAVM